MRTKLTKQHKLQITELQRRLIMRALTRALATDNHRMRADALADAEHGEWMRLVRLFATLDEGGASA